MWHISLKFQDKNYFLKLWKVTHEWCVQWNKGLRKNRCKIEISIKTFGYFVKFDFRNKIRKRKNRSFSWIFAFRVGPDGTAGPWNRKHFHREKGISFIYDRPKIGKVLPHTKKLLVICLFLGRFIYFGIAELRVYLDEHFLPSRNANQTNIKQIMAGKNHFGENGSTFQV